MGRNHVIGVLVILLWAVWAVTMPTHFATAQDPDNDGFTTDEEMAGILFWDLVSCNPGSDPQGNCTNADAIPLNPDAKDLFVILQRANPSAIPADIWGQEFAFLTRPAILAEGGYGLGVIVHPLSWSHTDPNYTRLVSPDCAQKAVSITEDPSPTGDILGDTPWTTPNGSPPAMGIVYAKRINNFVDSTCANKICQYADAATGQIKSAEKEVVKKVYIQHTMAHELAHALAITTDYNKRAGGHHYLSGSKVIMEQSVIYTDKSGKVTFYISDRFAAPDMQGVNLQ